MVSFDAPMDLVYFPNAFRVDKGAEHVAFYRLRPDARSINLVSTCCHTTLLVDNVNYHEAKDMEADDGMQVLLFPAVIKLSTNMIELTSASLNAARTPVSSGLSCSGLFMRCTSYSGPWPCPIIVEPPSTSLGYPSHSFQWKRSRSASDAPRIRK